MKEYCSVGFFLQVTVPAMGSCRTGEGSVETFCLRMSRAAETGQTLFTFTFNILAFWLNSFIFSRCYVGNSHTCSDARPSIYGSPYNASCQACRNRAREEEGESHLVFVSTLVLVMALVLFLAFQLYNICICICIFLFVHL